MYYLKHFNPARFFILLIIIGVLTLLSFLTAFGKDEGTLGGNLFLNFMADAYAFFRFPSHVLFWKFMQGPFFFIGLLINIIFYSFFIELVIVLFKMRTKS